MKKGPPSANGKIRDIKTWIKVFTYSQHNYFIKKSYENMSKDDASFTAGHNCFFKKRYQPVSVQAELENLVNYFAESVDNFSGTSLAAQNLNEMKKANFYTENGQTVIELNLNFDRAWSSVTKAMQVAEIVTNDKNRNDGIFYVSYSKEEEGGLLSFFGLGRSSNNNNAFNEEAQFEVTIVEKNNKTYVRARSMNGKIDEAEQLLSKINESLS